MRCKAKHFAFSIGERVSDIDLIQTSGSTCDRRLAVGAILVEEMRSAVAAETTFNCSAGVSHSKMFAKYACGMNKPNRQTVLPIEAGLYVKELRYKMKLRMLSANDANIRKRISALHRSFSTERKFCNRM